jgi:ubiquitin carboxyl-terminal hydrolase 35/38
VFASAKPPYFESGQQQDSSEFLIYLLQRLHELEKKLNDSRAPNQCKNQWTTEDNQAVAAPLNEHPAAASNEENSSAETLIEKIFDGRIETTYECLECGSNSGNVASFRDLQLSFPDSSPTTSLGPNYDESQYSVQKLLDILFLSEQLDGDNKYKCEKCATLCDAKRSMRIVKPPKNLILTLKHFRYDSKNNIRTKLINKVYHDEEIAVNILNKQRGQYVQLKYILFAAIVHSGSNIDSGHYYTFAADPPKHWFKFNDNYVSECSVQELHNLPLYNTPYILFYHLQEDDHNAKDDHMEVDCGKWRKQ